MGGKSTDFMRGLVEEVGVVELDEVGFCDFFDELGILFVLLESVVSSMDVEPVVA